MDHPRRLLFAFALLALSAASARAQCTTTPAPCVFPPGSCAYVNVGPGSSYAGGHALRLFDFESSTDCAPLPGGGVTDIQVVHGTALLAWTPSGGSPSVAGGPVVLTIKVVGGPPGNPRPFDVELLAMDLSGVAIPGGVLVRESPTIASLGQGTSAEGPPGTYLINSFFDIFTEISLDGGQLWVPSLDSQHLVLAPGPPLPARPATWGAVKAIYR